MWYNILRFCSELYTHDMRRFLKLSAGFSGRKCHKLANIRTGWTYVPLSAISGSLVPLSSLSPVAFLKKSNFHVHTNSILYVDVQSYILSGLFSFHQLTQILFRLPMPLEVSNISARFRSRMYRKLRKSSLW